MPEMVRQYPSGAFSLSDVEAAGEIVGFPVQRATVRSQIANYVNAKWLERVTNGTFRFTKAGLDALSELSISPGNAVSRLEAETPTADDVQAVGASLEDEVNVSPKASELLVAVGDIVPR
nr:hypothetical protein [uncultured Rhodopila sp.]